jgi:hypothetical protein
MEQCENEKGAALEEGHTVMVPFRNLAKFSE